MNRINRFWYRLVASPLGLALLLAPTVALRAQQNDINVRAARLSEVEGEVQLTNGDQVLADPALVNTPLFEGTLLTTKEDGRAELQFDDGSVARISPNSAVRIISLRQQDGSTSAVLSLESGLAYFEFQNGSSANRMVARFGDSAVTASGFTVVRISLDNPPGEVAVFSGNAHLERGKGLSLDLHGGESVALNGTDPNLYNLAETIEPDSWDDWNADRDQFLTSQQASKTPATSNGNEVNGNNPAWGDLDTNGNWYNVPGQGYVWSPYEASDEGWDPYGSGNWVWSPQYGYSWVSAEPWGYLPYTCGYWNFYDGFGWGWTPGVGYPWWSTGGWVVNVGHRPGRYEPPHRPHGGPVHPPVGPIRGRGLYQQNPVIAVNRIPTPSAGPVHVAGRPVTIAGTSVQPLRPISPRPIYNPSMNSGVSRSSQGNGNYQIHGYTGRGNPGFVGKPTYSPWANAGGTARPNTWGAPAPVPAPAPGQTYHAPPAGTYGGYSAGGSRPSGSNGSVHVNSGGGGSGRVSGGVGGGGGRVSAGGGGGGGHVNSGGGGGGGHAGGSVAPGGHH